MNFRASCSVDGAGLGEERERIRKGILGLRKGSLGKEVNFWILVESQEKSLLQSLRDF